METGGLEPVADGRLAVHAPGLGGSVPAAGFSPGLLVELAGHAHSGAGLPVAVVRGSQQWRIFLRAGGLGGATGHSPAGGWPGGDLCVAHRRGGHGLRPPCRGLPRRPQTLAALFLAAVLVSLGRAEWGMARGRRVQPLRWAGADQPRCRGSGGTRWRGGGPPGGPALPVCRVARVTGLPAGGGPPLRPVWHAVTGGNRRAAGGPRPGGCGRRDADAGGPGPENCPVSPARLVAAGAWHSQIPVSALLSGLVVKASFYIAARLWLEL